MCSPTERRDKALPGFAGTLRLGMGRNRQRLGRVDGSYGSETWVEEEGYVDVVPSKKKRAGRTERGEGGRRESAVDDAENDEFGRLWSCPFPLEEDHGRRSEKECEFVPVLCSPDFNLLPLLFKDEAGGAQPNVVSSPDHRATPPAVWLRSSR